MEFKVDTKDFDNFKQALAEYPGIIRAATARMLRDEAYNYKKFAVDELESTYTIRDKKFVEGAAWKVKVPDESDPIDQQQASVASLRIKDGGGLFTGWEEELTGAPREMRKGRGHYHRQIWSNAREDNSLYGKVLGKYRFRPGGEGFNSDIIPDSRDYGLSVPSFLAMLSKSLAPKKIKNEFDYYVFSNGRKRKKHFKEYTEPKRLLGKNRVFILGGANFPLGLYRFKDNEGLGETTRPEIVALQSFENKPVESAVGKFDWRGEAVSKTEKKFTPKYIWNKYLKPAIDLIWEK
jgi:hypothetical protein